MLDTIKRGVSPNDDIGEEGADEREAEGEGEHQNDSNDSNDSNANGKLHSLMQILLDEQIVDTKDTTQENGEEKNENEISQGETLRRIPSARALSRMPRLVYYETTMETVNAVQALVNAGEVDAANCCALLDKHEGMHFLESVLNRKVGLIKKREIEKLKRDIEAEMDNVKYEETYALSKKDDAGVQKAKKKNVALEKKLMDVDDKESKKDSGTLYFSKFEKSVFIVSLIY